MPLPARKLARTLAPDPLGATRITSTLGGGTTWVCSRYTMENPCEKYSAAPPRGLFDGEQALTRLPSVLHGLVPRLAALLLTHDHAEPVVAHVQGLGRSLHAVPNHRDDLIPEDLLG